MDSIDTFASLLLEEAKRFLELAGEASGDEGVNANLHASMVLAFCALEAHINAVSDEMALQKGLTAHEKSILLEREVRLENGQYKLKNALKMYRLEDRILFLFARFTKSTLDRDALWWARLKESLNIRNKISHPKDVSVLTKQDVEKSIQAIVDCLDALYQALYHRRLPAASRGLQSKLTF
jgi:hypothetical protein